MHYGGSPCFVFMELENAMAFDSYVYDKLIKIPNRRTYLANRRYIIGMTSK